MIAPDSQLDPKSNTLWHRIWLNVLPQSDLGLKNGNEISNPEKVFPWLIPTRTSEAKTGVVTTPEDVSLLQVFWGMPRRIRLIFRTAEEGSCGLCGKQDLCLVHYRTRPFGTNYTGAWKHPLTPHRDQGEGPVPLHPQRGGIGYRDWPAIVMGLSDLERNHHIQPAQVVFRTRHSSERCGDRVLVWTFGFDMDNMKARCWYEHTLPVFHLSEEQASTVRFEAGNMVTAANEVAGNLRTCLREAWFKRPKDARGDVSFVTQAFWHATESKFISGLEMLIAAVRQDSDYLEVLHSWFHTIDRASRDLFDGWSGVNDIGDDEPARRARAELRLLKFNRKKKIKSALQLDKKPEAVPA
jgi:CRISPR system Cascade subunit CasA